MAKKSKKIKFTKKTLLLAGLAAIVLAGILFVVFHNPKSSISIPSTSPPTSARASSPDKQPAVTGNSSNAASGNTSDKSTTSPPAGSTILIEPSGTFVSNHRPGQNGSPTGEQSVCNTTPGATCYIQFIKEGVTKKLDAQTADPSGATYWTWDVKQAGFSAGSWQITAIASLNGQTKTANDALTLEVQP